MTDKYEDQLKVSVPQPAENILVDGEKLIWQGKPKKSAFVLNKCLVSLPFVLIWLAFDGFFIFVVVKNGGWNQMAPFLIPFFAIHLFPVWKWISGIVTAGKKWRNTEYYVTDKRIVIRSGFIGIDYQTLYYKDINNVTLNIGVIDKLLGVGDIYFSTPGAVNTKNGGVAFLDITDAVSIYPQVQKVVMDIQTDIEYPNDLRPPHNGGYNTGYDGGIH